MLLACLTFLALAAVGTGLLALITAAGPTGFNRVGIAFLAHFFVFVAGSGCLSILLREWLSFLPDVFILVTAAWGVIVWLRFYKRYMT